MNLDRYLELKAERLNSRATFRENCLQCRRAQSACYCSAIRPFTSQPQFVILMHPNEVKKKIGTGRMAHLILSNSVLIQGDDFSANKKLNDLIHNPEFYPVVLYPGKNAVNLSELDFKQRQALFPVDRKTVFILIDGTWSQAKKVKKINPQLSHLPVMAFTPPKLSGFLVRGQPHAHCFSTIESIHYIIDLLGTGECQSHQNLIEVFDRMVQQQWNFMPEAAPRA